MSSRVEFENNGMARCGSCGEPCVMVIVGDPREIERDPNIVIRCTACAAIEAAETITRDAAA